MTEGFLYLFWSLFCLFWSLFGPEILYFGHRILYFGPGVLISLMESFIRNDRGNVVSFLVLFWFLFGPKSYILAMESYILDPES